MLTTSRVMRTLIRREFVEHRLMFLFCPATLVLLGTVTLAVWIATLPLPPPIDPEFFPNRTLTEAEIAFYRASTRASLFYGMAALPMSVLLITFWLSMTYYCLFGLYQQRKDRSILFWNSMPVSDTQTIVSRCLAGLVICHGVYLIGIALLDLFGLALQYMFTVVNGAIPISGTALRGVTPLPFSRTLTQFAYMPVNVLWSLPVYGWLLLASAWSRRAPFAWACGPLILLMLPQVMLERRSWLLEKLLEHAFPLKAFDHYGFSPPDADYPWLELAISMLLGAFFVFAAIRVNRSDAN
jgi:ABC-2 type transport system permease protein